MTGSIAEEIRQWIAEHQEDGYAEFQRRILPTLPPEKICGVRTPALRKYARELSRREDRMEFLRKLPHEFFEEDQLHAFILCESKDIRNCLEEVDRFLPYIDNWATCDQLSPKCFRKDRELLLVKIREWMQASEPYVVRFGIGMLMQHYLDDAFDLCYLEEVAAVHSDHYYIRMMVAWYFATALAKQPEATLPYLRQYRLEPWVHNKTIQKAVESYRIPDERKEYLKTLRVKKGNVHERNSHTDPADL